MQRYFISPSDFYENYAIIHEYHHIHNVMRYQVGKEVIVATSDGKSYLTKISAFLEDAVKVEVIEELSSNELDLEVTLAMGLVNNQKMELIIQKATELGAARIIPVNMTRCIIKDKGNKQERFEKIAKEAAEQSHRSLVPEITKTVNLKDLDGDYDLKLFAYESSHDYKSLVKKVRESKKVLIVIGPEGGFDEKEVALLESKGFINVSLGKRILRAETAAFTSLALMMLIKELNYD